MKRENILLVGSGDRLKEIKDLILKKEKHGTLCEIALEEMQRLNDIVDLDYITQIILLDERFTNIQARKIFQLKLKGIKVFDYFSFLEETEEKISINSVNEKWMLLEKGFNILHDDFQQNLKRVFDLLLAILIGTLTLPIVGIASILVKLESRGPILFKQTRVGFNNEEFKIYKFRSMKVHDPNKHSKYAQDNDSRITKFGNFMRKTRIDEFPQLWNILKGDMSFVGPRAEWNELCYEYAEKIPFYNIRHSVKPGLTGWAQVKYPYGVGVEDALKKLEYDLYYIKHQNFILDIIIMFKTAKIVFFGKGK